MITNGIGELLFQTREISKMMQDFWVRRCKDKLDSYAAVKFTLGIILGVFTVVYYMV